MKILIYSPAFHPNVGGLEMVMLILAHEFVCAGHSVKVVSTALDPDESSFTFEVIRSPASREFLALMRWCEVFFMGNISLKGMWPLLLTPRTVVATHQGWYCRSNDETGWQDKLKFLVSRFITNISSSQAVADHLPSKSVVIHNPYRDDLFHEITDSVRDRDIAFLGRLVSQKGGDILINALLHLRNEGLTPSVTIIGDGPEKEKLCNLCLSEGMEEQITFVGKRRDMELVELLNRHKIMIVPSRVREGLPLVVLEGIACGCYVLGSDLGGVPEAIGPCGETYHGDSYIDLAAKLKDILLSERWKTVANETRSRHLQVHEMQATAYRYLDVIERAYKSSSLG
jgi:glycosyltransferase involved in cell wall biosynthesis